MQMKEEFFRMLFEKSPNAIAYQELLWDENGSVCDCALLAVNPKFAELFAASRSEIEGMRFSEFYPIQDEKTERYLVMLNEVATSGESVTFNMYVRALKKWLRISLFVLDKDCIASICTDITREVLQEQEMEGFLKANLDMLCVIDTAGCFVKENKEFEDVLGYRSEKLEGRSLFSLLHADDREMTENMLLEMKTQQKSVRFINRCRTKSGEYKYIEWHLQAIGQYIYASARDVSETMCLNLKLQESNERLTKQAVTDKLTGLHNRYFLEERLQEEFERADRYDEALSMVLFDLDHFKKVNDTWGHLVGDDVLMQAAATARYFIRSSDFLARIGGEEFALVMPQTPLAGAVKAAEKIRSALGQCIHPHAGQVTASFGVAQRMKGESFKNWYQRTDAALYRAKNNGRNCVASCSEPELAPLATISLEWRSCWESGWEEIDAQHRQMFELANVLLNANGPDVSKESLLPPLERLLEHVRHHFSAEEKILAKVNYPQAEEHGKLHHKLLAKAVRLKDGYVSEEIRPSAFFSFLVDDLVLEHLLKEDVKFFPYLP
ncbi:diguanylate cyclase [Azotosporobacter soli]|uniref:diguanylate cyclase n=1 Tax=Azotosporobacter soli TaxID=3055040 RepID=UPI0031FED1D0